MTRQPTIASPLAELETVILAGGQGTRLRQILPDRQKVLATVAERPFLEHILDRIAAAGCQKVILALGHLADQATPIIGAGGQWPGMERLASIEREPLGTGGALRLALALTQGDTLIALNGDSLSHIDWPRLLTAHRTAGAALTMALTAVDDTTRFGSVVTAADGRVVSFNEKGRAGPGLINAGVYVLQREVVAALPTGQHVSLETHVLPGLVASGRLCAAPVASQFIDIGTPETLAQATDFVLRTSINAAADEP